MLNKGLIYLVILASLAAAGCNNQLNEKNQHSQNKLFSYSELLRKKTYRSLKEAGKDPEKVYKLVLFNKSIDTIPRRIFRLSSLNSLELSGNQISELPGKMKQLKYIQSLYLNENEFSEFPRVVYELNHLKRLNISSNPLNKIPGDIHRLNGIREL